VPESHDVTVPGVHDVIVVGGGPAGSTTGAFLARAGRRVLLFEREPFPRFHVGESLLPATLPILERMGALATVAERGFQVKYGATFHDQESDFQRTFYFLTNKPWPSYSYQVHRADFDALLLEHAATHGVDVRQRATVESIAFDADGVSVAARRDGLPITARARFLVDASGRDGLIATKLGRRERIPNLGKVALFAHFRGAGRLPGRDEGNIFIHVFQDGWFWWIPLANDLTSLGCVMHARTVRGWPGQLDELYAEMIRRCPRVAHRLVGGERVTEIHRVANFSYMNGPLLGDRFLVVGDAIASWTRSSRSASTSPCRRASWLPGRWTGRSRTAGSRPRGSRPISGPSSAASGLSSASSTSTTSPRFSRCSCGRRRAGSWRPSSVCSRAVPS